MKTVGSAIREFQVGCLLRAQDSLVKARSGGFPLPDDVAQGVQEIMNRIPQLIARLKQGVSPGSPDPRGDKRAVHEPV